MAPPPDVLRGLRALTPARVGLGRSGHSLPTRAVLNLAMVHALARDAVHTAFDAVTIQAGLAGLGLSAITVSSAADSRAVYLRRPDLGRALAPESNAALRALDPAPSDVAFVVADGLSARAVHEQALPVVTALLPLLSAAGFRIGPAAVARNGRVALGDAVGSLLNARLVVVLIGERPGLSTPDSLGLYITLHPATGRSDADRNCISNVHGRGLSAAEAAHKAAWIIGEAFRRGQTGVALKDESGDVAALAATSRLAAPAP